MNNFQMYRHIQSPGWTLGWTWAKKEVIWSMIGAQTTEQGDCSKFKSNIPHCCKKAPTIVDLLSNCSLVFLTINSSPTAAKVEQLPCGDRIRHLLSRLSRLVSGQLGHPTRRSNSPRTSLCQVQAQVTHVALQRWFLLPISSLQIVAGKLRL